MGCTRAWRSYSNCRESGSSSRRFKAIYLKGVVHLLNRSVLLLMLAQGEES